MKRKNNPFLLKLALQEANKRLNTTTAFNLERSCFPEQVAFIRDKSRFKAACLPRRAGKTTTCAYDLIAKALERPNVVCLYITLARSNAKRLIWSMLKQILYDDQIPYEPNESDLCITFKNGSKIYCSGAKDKSEIEKFRGLALYLVYIDECQAFKSYIRELIDDVISPALRDYSGTTAFIGTPGPVPSGMFYEILHSKQYSTHFWNGSANPHLLAKSGKTFDEQLKEELERMACTVDHPTIQREWFANWVLDTNKQVYKYTNANDYSNLPKLDNYIMGVDLGYEDSDAIAVLGWSNHSRVVYLVEEVLKAKQGITPLANTLKELRDKYKPRKIVMDAGGLGKKIAEEISSRHLIDIQAAEKTRKFEFIELVNDALRRRELFAKSNSYFARDAALVEWELPHVSLKDNYHSDMCFIAGTKVLTPTGPKPIEKLKVGDFVIAGSGNPQQIQSCMTSTAQTILITLSTGEQITTTPNHPFWVEDKWIPAANLLGKNLTTYATTNPKNTGSDLIKMEPKCFIEQSGNIIMDLYQKASTFITSIVTPQTTTYQILPVYLKRNTTENINRIDLNIQVDLNALNILDPFNHLLKNGMLQKKELLGTNNIVRRTLFFIQRLKQSVVSATLSMKRLLELKEKLAAVPMFALVKKEEIQSSTMKQESVLVAKNSQLTNTTKQKPVVVVAVQPLEQNQVYNITVALEANYFVGDTQVLVSNCDAVLYSYRECLHWLETLLPPPLSKEEKQAQVEQQMLDKATEELHDEDTLDEDYYTL